MLGFFSRVLISCTALRELGLFILLKTYFYLKIEKDKNQFTKELFVIFTLECFLNFMIAFKVSVCLRS